jgi:hypothetical protein
MKQLVQVATAFGLLPGWGVASISVAGTGTFAAVLAHADAWIYGLLAAACAVAAGLAVLLAVLVRRGRADVTPRAEVARMAALVRAAPPVPASRRPAARPAPMVLRLRVVPGTVIRTEAASETSR